MCRYCATLVLMLLLAAAPAQADVRTFVMFDMSNSMKRLVTTPLCWGPQRECSEAKAEAQLRAFSGALSSLQPQCVPLSLKTVFWNVMIRYGSEWVDVSDEVGIQSVRKALQVAPRAFGNYTYQWHAFLYAMRILRYAPRHDYAVIMVSDGYSSDGWQPELARTIAAEHGALLFNLVFDDKMSVPELEAEFKRTFATIEDHLHGCID